MGADSNFIVGWCGMLAGVMSGTVLGLYFHQEEWQGGYGSFRRRLIRLGHISFIGLGTINVLFALSARASASAAPSLFSQIASVALNVGAVTMPICCFLTAWRTSLRRFFAVPVAAEFVGILAFIVGWLRQ